MAITSQIDESKDLTIYTVTGVLSFDDAMSAVKAFYDGDPTRHVLWDMTDATELLLDSHEVKLIATYGPRLEKEKRKAGKTAFVAQSNLYFGMSRMFEAHSEIVNSPYPVMVFRNIEDAYKWLAEPIE